MTFCHVRLNILKAKNEIVNPAAIPASDPALQARG